MVMLLLPSTPPGTVNQAFGMAMTIVGAGVGGWLVLNQQLTLGQLVAAEIIVTAIVASVAVTLIGIPPSTVVARESGKEDPGFVVIDEVAGQLVALMLERQALTLE